MKKTDNKNSKARFKSTIALILAMIIVVGLLSSTAIRLITATYLMKSSKVDTGIPVLDAIIEEVIDNVPAPATTAAPVTAAPTTTAPAATTTTAPATTVADTQAPTTTEAEETVTDAPTTQATTVKPTEGESTTSEKQFVQYNQKNLKSYNDLLYKNKLKGHRPGFTKTTERTLSKNLIASVWFSDIESNPTISNYLGVKSTKVDKGTATTELGLSNLKYGSTLDDANYKTVKKAVKDSSRNVVYMCYIKATNGDLIHAYDRDADTGEISVYFDDYEDYKVVKQKKAVRVGVSFNDEKNPVPADENGKSKSFIASVFPVVTGTQVRDAMLKSGVTDVNLTYKDCAVTVYYDTADGEIYELRQNVNFDVEVKDGIVKSTGTVKEVIVYDEFVY